MIKKIKSRFLCLLLSVLSVVTMISPISAQAADNNYDGGWNMVTTDVTVVDKNGSYVGYIYAGEGVTVLTFPENNMCEVEFSTPSGPKVGYVHSSNLLYYLNGRPGSCVGTISTSTTTYYDTSPALAAGSVSKGERVAVLCKSRGWAYIEYNVYDGTRKRGFIPSSCVTCYGYPPVSLYQDTMNESFTVESTMTVYSGPSRAYPVIGEVYTSDNGNIYCHDIIQMSGAEYAYLISYPASGATKYGYVLRFGPD